MRGCILTCTTLRRENLSELWNFSRGYPNFCVCDTALRHLTAKREKGGGEGRGTTTEKGKRGRGRKRDTL